MKIKVNNDLGVRDPNTQERMTLSKGTHKVDSKWGNWLCQVYPLNVSVSTDVSEPAKVSEPVVPVTPKAKPKAKKKVAKKGKK